MRPARRRPNLLLIMTDQQRHDQVGYASGGYFETPNLDRLARQGLIFDCAYSGSTVCIPSRTSLLTGMLDHRVPKAPSSHAMQEGFWTLAHALRRAGYATGLIGKMHLTPIHAQHGFDVMRMCEHLDENSGYGPDDIDDYHKWLLWQGRADFRATHHFGPGLADPESEFDNWYSAVPFGYDRYFHPTEWVKRESIDFLKAQSQSRPFFLVVSFPHPHSPYDPPEPYASLYDAAQARLPVDGFESNRALPPAFRDALASESARAPDEVLRRILTFVRALVRQIDDALGEMLAHVDLTTTNLFFTSDHGDYAGHRGIIAKSPWIAFDDLAKVPFFCVGPDVAGGRRVSAPVQSADYVLTGLDFAGLELPKSINDTRSLRAVLRGEPADESRTIFSCTSFGWPMARTGALKYFHHAPTGDEMLFDVARDPGETQNLIADRGYADAARELRHRLEEKLAEGIPGLPRFPGFEGRSVAAVAERDDSAAPLAPAECVARAFTLLTEKSLIASSNVALAEATCSALARRRVELGAERANAAELVRQFEDLRGDDANAHWIAIGAMVRAAGDPHTLYLSAEAQDQLVAALSGKPCSAPGFFAHEAEGGWVVSEVLAGGPAAEASLAPGDVIARIDGDAVQEGCLLDLWFRPAGSKVTLEIHGNRGEHAVVMSLWPWTPPLASFRVMPGGDAGVIRVYLFAGSPAAEGGVMSLARAALSAFDRRGVERVVIDLRGTLGATAMDEFISLFTIKDPLAIFRARNGEEAPLKRKGEAWPKRYALAALIDEQTTSAGAIVAAALEDLEGAITVGQPTKSVLTLPKPHALGSGASLYVPHFEVLGSASGKPRPERRLVPAQIAPNRTAADLFAGRDPQLDVAAS